MPILKMLPDGQAMLMVGENKPLTKPMPVEKARLKLKLLLKERERVLARQGLGPFPKQQSNEG